MVKRSIAAFLVVLAAGAGLLAGVLLVSRSRGRKTPRALPANPSAAQPKRKILYWWDPMLGPSSISPTPGVSAMGMKLVPVYAPAPTRRAGEVRINPAIEQDLGVQTSPVQIGTLHKTVRTVGYFREATPQSYAVTVRTSGWIGTLYASTDGTVIHRGDPLFTLYSPTLLAAEEELLAAAKNRVRAGHAHDAEAVAEARRVERSIRQRLVYLGVSAAEVDRIVSQRKTQEYVTFVSPVSGDLGQVSVRQRSFIRSGRSVMRIDQLRTVWLDAHVYDNQLPWLRLGETLHARVAADPGRVLNGTIFFIDPDEDPRTHTVTVRARFANPDGVLRPGMYALVNIQTTPLKKTLLVPSSAIIHTGTGDVVLVAMGGGRFVPRKIVTGVSGDGQMQVLAGLETGEEVVTSGQFLIDVQSNMSELATKLMARGPAQRHPKHESARPAAPPTGR